MKNKNTKYRKPYNIKLIIPAYLIFGIILIKLIEHFLNPNSSYEFLWCLIILTIATISITSSISGLLKGVLQIQKEKKYIKKTNPYIYYRELPNNFGIGVTSLLFDSTIENYKDIVATILDLCARKYLNLIKQNDKYIIKNLKNIDDNLLSNEKYILNLIINNNIKNINYQEWYNLCMQDGINLGLYYHKKIQINNEPPPTQNKEQKIKKICLLTSIIIGIIIFLIILTEYNLLTALIYSIFCSILIYVILYLILIILFYTIDLVAAFKYLGKQTKQTSYKNIIENTLIKTEKGVEELHKLYSFKAFINDFGNFIDKKADEVVLWDRYLSYAQVFGLTKEIMKSGYKELVNNSSFQIDNIDNIDLHNIEIDSN